MRKNIACVSDLYSILNDSNIQLSNKQKEEVVNVIYPHIEESCIQSYKLGKESAPVLKKWG